MNKKFNIRSMAIEAIDLISHKSGFSNDIIQDKVKKIADIRNKNLFRVLVYGTTENLIYIDYMIRRLSSIRLKKMDHIVLNAMRLAIYEMVFLRIETYATINEYVEIIKNRKNKKLANFLNANLRTFDKDKKKYTKVTLEDSIENIATRYSYNIDIVNYLVKSYGFDQAKKIIKSMHSRPRLSARVNTLKTTKKELFKMLETKGYILEDSNITKDGFIIKNPNNLVLTEEFKNGLFTIQDQGSIKVCEVLNPKTRSKILDLCAAPGSKSTHLAQICGDKSLIVANDISSAKLYKIKENFQRLGFTNYKIENFDASMPINQYMDQFDYVLVDAPCSGIGVISRKPEIKIFRTLEDIKSLAKLQLKILTNAAKYVKVGGTIVYSTCTLGPIENEMVIKEFLTNNNFKKINIEGKESISLMPHLNEADGFYICKMTRIS